MSDNPNTPVSGTVLPRSRSRRTGWIVAMVIAAGLTGAAATSAFSHGPGFGHGFGHGFGPGGWHGRFMGGPLDAAQIEDRADRMVRQSPSRSTRPPSSRTSFAPWSKAR